MRHVIHKDLRTPKYRVRVTKNKKKERDKYACRRKAA